MFEILKSETCTKKKCLNTTKPKKQLKLHIDYLKKKYYFEFDLNTMYKKSLYLTPIS